MLKLIAFGSPEKYSIDEQNYARNFILTYQNMCTGITPASEKKSINRKYCIEEKQHITVLVLLVDFFCFISKL